MIPSPTKPIFMTPPARLGETRSPHIATVSAEASSRAAVCSATAAGLPKFEKLRRASNSGRCVRVEMWRAREQEPWRWRERPLHQCQIGERPRMCSDRGVVILADDIDVPVGCIKIGEDRSL